MPEIINAIKSPAIAITALGTSIKDTNGCSLKNFSTT